MATRAPGSYIWLPHETDIFVPAKVLTAFKPGEPTKCQSDDGETHNLTDTAKIDVCDSQCLDSSIDNLIMARCRRVPWRLDVLSSAGGPLPTLATTTTLHLTCRSRRRSRRSSP